MQYLDPNDPDPTAIPYGEKLKKYLESVLIGDALAEQIRAAFDAYVFLSYRKKDRKYAQELMRLLHRDPVCRDIAIWYDEFLTPGENFNASIQAALEKSRLFVLAVTPNLVNESNYVMTTEYPMAKDAGKPVLPAEMVETDRDSLQKNYPGIPESVDPANDLQLSEALVNALGKLAIRENDQNPRHNLFIGLAYLGGVDVEVDHERAVARITGAAEAGLTEAMEKLVAMYESGEGVPRDYLEAIHWRERLTEQARVAYETTGTERDGNRYFSQLWHLGDAWRAVARLVEARQSYEEMHVLAQERWKEDPSDGHSSLLFVAYNRLGDISQREGNLVEAKSWYIRSLEIREKLAQTATVQALRDLSVSYNQLGNISQQEGNLTEAKSWHTRGLEITEKLAQTGTAEAYEDLAFSCYLLGMVDSNTELLNRALKLYEMLATWCPGVPLYSQNAEIVRQETVKLSQPSAPEDVLKKMLEALLANTDSQNAEIVRQETVKLSQPSAPEDDLMKLLEALLAELDEED